MNIILSLYALTFLQKADSFFFNMQYDSAKFYYFKALEKDTSNHEVYWKLARLYCNIGDTARDKKQRKFFYKKAIEFSKKAVEIDPKSSEAHLWLGASYGDMAIFLGGKKKIEYAFKVKNEVEKALKLNPACALYYYILGRYQYEAATLNPFLKKTAKILFGKVPEGTVDSAFVLLNRAIELDSTEIKYYVARGEVLRKMGREEEAKRDFEKALKLKIKYPVDEKYRKKALQYLNK